MKQKPELLAPAGNFEKLRAAVLYGADAVYLAGGAFGMRAAAGNFTDEELPRAAAYAHERGVRVYLAVNTMPRTSEYPALEAYLNFVRGCGVDALIVGDLGVLSLARRIAPELEVHVSTQASAVSLADVLAWRALGARRVVLARELSIEEVRQICEGVPGDMEIECFIHGAMCVAYSGRCLLSNYFTGRDANRGACAQPCRWNYRTLEICEEKRPDQPLGLYEDAAGTFVMSSRDMCMIEHIPELVEAGIDSLKIEGRMKTALYVATVARTYRKAIDDYFADPELYEKNMDWYKAEISKCTYRQFTTGFYFGKPDENTQIYDNNTYVNEYIYLGIVEAVKDSLCRIEQRNKFCVGDSIEIMKPDGTNVPVTVEAMYTDDGESVDSAPHPKQVLWIKLSMPPQEFDLLRQKNAD